MWRTPDSQLSSQPCPIASLSRGWGWWLIMYHWREWLCWPQIHWSYPTLSDYVLYYMYSDQFNSNDSVYNTTCIVIICLLLFIVITVCMCSGSCLWWTVCAIFGLIIIILIIIQVDMFHWLTIYFISTAAADTQIVAHVTIITSVCINNLFIHLILLRLCINMTTAGCQYNVQIVIVVIRMLMYKVLGHRCSTTIARC